jgi:hypothetical protein
LTRPKARSRTAPRPISARFEPVELLRGLTTDFLRAPSRLACRTRTVWQYRHVPSLSGLLAALPGVSRLRLPSASTEPLRRPGGGVLSPPHGHEALRGARFPRSARMRCGRAGCPLYPGGDGVPATIGASVVAVCRLATAGPCHPGTTCRPGMSD